MRSPNSLDISVLGSQWIGQKLRRCGLTRGVVSMETGLEVSKGRHHWKFILSVPCWQLKMPVLSCSCPLPDATHPYHLCGIISPINSSVGCLGHGLLSEHQKNNEDTQQPESCPWNLGWKERTDSGKLSSGHIYRVCGLCTLTCRHTAAATSHHSSKNSSGGK